MIEPYLPLLRMLSFAAFAGSFVLLLTWEGGEPRHAFADRAGRRRHLTRNMLLFALVILFSDYAVGTFLLDVQRFVLEPPASGLGLVALPLPLQIVIGVLASDLLGYWLHRFSHRYEWMWRLHSVHHSDPVLDASTSLRHHPVEAALYIVPKIALYAVLGLPFWIEAVRAVLINVVSVAQHANVVFPAWFESLRVCFVTPGIHRVHHDTRRELHDSNFGGVFSFWDRLFGTYTVPESVRDSRIGLDGYDGEAWQSLPGMLATPLRGFPDPGGTTDTARV